MATGCSSSAVRIQCKHKYKQNPTIFIHRAMGRKDYGALAMKIFGIVVHFYFSAAWVFLVALSYLVCHILRNEFKFLGKEIEESTDFKRKSLSTNLENFRWQHIKYTAMVGHANDFLTYHLAASCLVNVVSFS